MSLNEFQQAMFEKYQKQHKPTRQIGVRHMQQANKPKLVLNDNQGTYQNTRFRRGECVDTSTSYRTNRFESQGDSATNANFFSKRNGKSNEAAAKQKAHIQNMISPP